MYKNRRDYDAAMEEYGRIVDGRKQAAFESMISGYARLKSKTNTGYASGKDLYDFKKSLKVKENYLI